MIIRRYGNRFHSVVIDFDPAAMTEVGFRKDGKREWEAEEFLDAYQMVREEEISAEATDPVQATAERIMLDALEEKFKAVHAGLEEGQYLSIESRTGVDHPRTRHQRSKIGDQEFTYSLNHPLRLGVWEKKAG
ncbi:MAG: hypothetical protein ABIF09_06900 [Gemmatimonadota bacterium]